jgi:hypothetical protein
MFQTVRVDVVDAVSRTAKCYRETDNMCIVDVRWCTSFGTNGTPVPKSRCALAFVSGVPYLLFELDAVTPLGGITPSSSMGSGVSMPVVSTSGAQGGATGTGQAPSDSVPGDHTMGGGVRGIVAAMLGGAVLLKASALASVFLSRLASLVRITSRRYELISDAATEVHANVGNATYRYQEVYASLPDMRSDAPAYVEAAGATATALACQHTWQGASPATEAPDPLLFMQAVTRKLEDDSREVSYTRTLSAGGKETITTGNTTVETDGTSHKITVAGDATAVVLIKDGEISLTVGTAVVKLTPESLTSNVIVKAPDFVVMTGEDEAFRTSTHEHGGVMAGGSDTSGPHAP